VELVWELFDTPTYMHSIVQRMGEILSLNEMFYRNRIWEIFSQDIEAL
jgi:hypothetical protein